MKLEQAAFENPHALMVLIQSRPEAAGISATYITALMLIMSSSVVCL